MVIAHVAKVFAAYASLRRYYCRTIGHEGGRLCWFDQAFSIRLNYLGGRTGISVEHRVSKVEGRRDSDGEPYASICQE